VEVGKSKRLGQQLEHVRRWHVEAWAGELGGGEGCFSGHARPGRHKERKSNVKRVVLIAPPNHPLAEGHRGEEPRAPGPVSWRGLLTAACPIPLPTPAHTNSDGHALKSLRAGRALRNKMSALCQNRSRCRCAAACPPANRVPSWPHFTRHHKLMGVSGLALHA
jgi:hypothetical protein